jgi:catechol 2,3-dioxygenase-like lactoylglutathione lyase family enzyme
VPVTLEELTIADAPEVWRECGFEVVGEECVVGDIRICFEPREGERGIVGWSLCGVKSSELDGLPTSRSGSRTQLSPHTGDKSVQSSHPNGVTGLDHVVAISPDLDRTVAALEAAGLDLRRIREEPTPAGAPRQAFFRLGASILEVVQEPAEATARRGGDRPAFFWGLAFVVPDLERTVAFLGEDRVGKARSAVQPGRRIATLRRNAGLSVPVALMTPVNRESAKTVE